MTIPNLDANGKVVVVTGGSKGLGREMALGFAEAGADLVVASRKLDACEAVAAEIRALGRARWPCAATSATGTQCRRLVERPSRSTAASTCW